MRFDGGDESVVVFVAAIFDVWFSRLSTLSKAGGQRLKTKLREQEILSALFDVRLENTSSKHWL